MNLRRAQRSPKVTTFHLASSYRHHASETRDLRLEQLVRPRVRGPLLSHRALPRAEFLNVGFPRDEPVYSQKPERCAVKKRVSRDIRLPATAENSNRNINIALALLNVLTLQVDSCHRTTHTVRLIKKSRHSRQKHIGGPRKKLAGIE